MALKRTAEDGGGKEGRRARVRVERRRLEGRRREEKRRDERDRTLAIVSVRRGFPRIRVLVSVELDCE